MATIVVATTVATDWTRPSRAGMKEGVKAIRIGSPLLAFVLLPVSPWDGAAAAPIRNSQKALHILTRYGTLGGFKRTENFR